MNGVGFEVYVAVVEESDFIPSGSGVGEGEDEGVDHG